MTTIVGVGPQLARAAAGSDPRGILTFAWLPEDLQRAEDSTAVNDRDTMKPRGFERPATDAEVALLRHLGYTVPDDGSLRTFVHFKTRSVRHRFWPALEDQSPEVTP